MDLPENVREAAVERFDIDPLSLKKLSSSDRIAFRCRAGSLGYALKFLPMPENPVERFEEKLRFFRYLSENGVAVSLPVPSKNGQAFEWVPAQTGGYLVTLAPLVDGRHPEPRNLYDWNERLFREWGAVMGKMHALTRRYPYAEPSPPGLPPSCLMDWEGELERFLEWSKVAKVNARLKELRTFFQGLPRDRASYGLVHNDMHPENFIYQPDANNSPVLTITEFDACAYHWFLNDIAIPLYYGLTYGYLKGLPERRAFSRRFLQHFLQGYEQENDLDAAWLTYLPQFLQYRELVVYTALSDAWPEDARLPYQKRVLAEKHGRILRGEPIL